MPLPGQVVKIKNAKVLKSGKKEFAGKICRIIKSFDRPENPYVLVGYDDRSNLQFAWSKEEFYQVERGRGGDWQRV